MGSARPLRTSARNAGSTFSSVLSKAHSRELPARSRIEEISVACPAVTTGRCAAGAFQHHLPAHELSIIFADGSGIWPESGVGKIGRAGPLPHIPERPTARARQGRTSLVKLMANHWV